MRLIVLTSRVLVAVAAAAGALALAAGPAAASLPPLRGTLDQGTFTSKALAGPVSYSVYLPAGYADSDASYPVIYFLHGLPSTPTAYQAIKWIARAVDQSGGSAIVVGAQGARTGDTDDEWLDWGTGRNWEQATSKELVRTIDSRYRTIRDRTGRAIIGYSAGGYGATLIGFHHPAEYSVIQSWSGYFQPTNPSGTATLDLGSARANAAANMYSLVPRLRQRMGRYYTRTSFDFYVGRSDHRFRSYNDKLNRTLTAARFPHSYYAIYPGRHGISLWEREAPSWIARAVKQLAPPANTGGASAG